MKVFNSSEFSNWILEHAKIESNSEYAHVAVDFPNSLMEWFDPMDVADFVAELFPLRDWCCTNVSPGEDNFRVSLVWYIEDEIGKETA
jgi:hypothetical protein